MELKLARLGLEGLCVFLFFIIPRRQLVESHRPSGPVAILPHLFSDWGPSIPSMIPCNLILLQLLGLLINNQGQDLGELQLFDQPAVSIYTVIMPCPCPFNSGYLRIRIPATRCSLHNVNNTVLSPSIQFNSTIDVFRAGLSSTPHRAAAIRDPPPRQSIRLWHPNGWAARGGAAEHGAAGA